MNPVAKAFFGKFKHSIDKQRRLAVPSDWRGKKDTVFYLVPAPNREIAMLTEKMFNQQILEPAREVALTDAEGGEAMSDLGTIGQVCQCDSQGRICLSQELMEYAGLEISGMALLKGGITTIRISRVPEQEAPGTERAQAFLDRLEAINKQRNNQ